MNHKKEPTYFCNTCTHTHTQTLYSPFPQGAREDNRGRHTDHPAGRHSIQTNRWPPPSSNGF